MNGRSFQIGMMTLVALLASSTGSFAQWITQSFELKAGWNGFRGYDRWLERQPNNAQIASVTIYTQMVPAFQALLRAQGGDLPAFYGAVRELAALPREERDARLRRLAGAVPAANADRRP